MTNSEPFGTSAEAAERPIETMAVAPATESRVAPAQEAAPPPA